MIVNDEFICSKIKKNAYKTIFSAQLEDNIDEFAMEFTMIVKCCDRERKI